MLDGCHWCAGFALVRWFGFFFINFLKLILFLVDFQDFSPKEVAELSGKKRFLPNRGKKEIHSRWRPVILIGTSDWLTFWFFSSDNCCKLTWALSARIFGYSEQFDRGGRLQRRRFVFYFELYSRLDRRNPGKTRSDFRTMRSKIWINP